MTPPPIPNSYWVREGLLLASEYPGQKDPSGARVKLGKFLDAGLRSFLDLTCEAELEPYAPVLRQLAVERGLEVKYARMPIRDGGVPRSDAEMRTILDRISAEIAAGRPCCVHCWGGCGRTGTVVGCYLVRNGLPADEALRFIMARWMTVPKHTRMTLSPETEEQRRYVREWQPGK